MASEGQFEDADALSPAMSGLTNSPSPEEDSDSEEGDYWDLEDEDWQDETNDFTKKLNAVRSGHVGANPQKGKMQTKNNWEVSQKSIHVSFTCLWSNYSETAE